MSGWRRRRVRFSWAEMVSAKRVMARMRFMSRSVIAHARGWQCHDAATEIRAFVLFSIKMVQSFCPVCGDPLPEHARFCKGCKLLVSATSPCISCGGLIPREVEKCTHCDSYQNWRRWFAVSSTMLAVATALVSVVGLTINTCAMVATPRSSTTATITGATQENLLIAVINSGNAPSVVRNFTFTVDGHVLELERIWTLKEDEPKHFLKG